MRSRTGLLGGRSSGRLSGGRSSGWLSVAALCVGLSVCGSANAFFVTYSNLIVASCTSTQVTGQVNASYSLPAANNNLVAFVSLNNSPKQTTFYTQNPPSFNGVLFFTYNIPVTAQPYTISADVLPALNGVANGTGVTGGFTCNANGTVDAVFTPTGSPTATTGVPTLSTWALVALALVLGFGAALQLRRRNAQS